MSSIGWYILAIVLFPTILMGVDAYIGYKKGDAEPRGISGFRRSIIALTVILILGIAVFHLLGSSAADQESRRVVSNVLSMLAGLVAAIAGFYFGGRATEKPLERMEEMAKHAEERAETERVKREEAEVKVTAEKVKRKEAEKRLSTGGL